MYLSGDTSIALSSVGCQGMGDLL